VKWQLIVRDLISVSVGAFGLIHSQITGQVNMELVLAYIALLGYPGALQLLSKNDSGSGRSSYSHSGDSPPQS
jgi:hypothetical protein